MNNVVITVVGRDTVGIIAKVCTCLADANVNVLDISQTIVRDFFNMMMVADFSGARRPFDEIAADLRAIGDDLGLQIRCQREEIFDMMHRV
ncbi:MAG: ACT domain-containing protein [Kiritimatiellae bacterium]|nr:ACT domain-containing protein [Kiritimatiellia bacterium]